MLGTEYVTSQVAQQCSPTYIIPSLQVTEERDCWSAYTHHRLPRRNGGQKNMLPLLHQMEWKAILRRAAERGPKELQIC